MWRRRVDHAGLGTAHDGNGARPEHPEGAARAFVARCADSLRYRYHAQHLRPVAGDLCLDEHCARLIGIDGELSLTKSQRAVFGALLEARDCPVSADTLAARLAGGTDQIPLTKTVRNAVWLIRRGLGEISSCARIETRYGFGYRLRIIEPDPFRTAPAGDTADW